MERGPNVRKGHLTLYASAGVRGASLSLQGKQLMSWYETLASVRNSFTTAYTLPQELADGWTTVMTEACRWFHESEWRMEPAWDYLDTLPDSEVESRIEGYQNGYDKEYVRRVRVNTWSDFYGIAEGYKEQPERYDFTSFPTWMKRTVVSRWDALHYEWLEKTGMKYDPDFGYFWLINGVKIKNVSTDYGKCPTEEDSPYDGVTSHITTGYTGWF